MLDAKIILYMLGLTVSLVAGVLLGYFLRNKRRMSLNRITLGIIIILIFSLGFSIGSSNELLSALPKVGLDALVITLLAICFSVVFAKIAGKMVKLE
ncbi:MAG TPA: LysO family transporter [Candidatus Acidoferrum sp.]|nr:LysO family transporter [Candidatus Acidoferrum sp.]